MRRGYRSVGIFAFLLVVLPLVLLVLCPHESQAQLLPERQEGFRTMLSQKGLDYFVEVIAPAIPQMLYETSIPAIEGESNGLKFSLHNFQFTYMNMKNIVAKWAEPIGVSAGVKNASLTLAFDYSFIYTNYPPFSFKGSDGRIDITDLSIQVVASVMSDDQGSEVLDVVASTTNIGSIEISLGSSSFINLILSIMTPILTNSLETILSQLVAEIIKIVINPQIALEVVLPTGVEELVSKGVDNKINTEDDIYKGVFIDFRLPSDPEFTSDLMITKKTGRWFNANFNKCFGTCSSDNIVPNSDIRFDSIEWDGYDINLGDEELPSMLFSTEVQVSVKCDIWKSLWATFIQYGYFNSSVSSVDDNGRTKKVNILVQCPEQKLEESSDIHKNQVGAIAIDDPCYETRDFDTNLVTQYLSNFSTLFPSSQFGVKIDYNIHSYYSSSEPEEEIVFKHETMYTGILIRVPGTLTLNVFDKSAKTEKRVLSITGYIELSQVPVMKLGTDILYLEFYYHNIHYDTIDIDREYINEGWYNPDTINTYDDDSELTKAVLSYLFNGILPYLETWSMDYGIQTRILRGYVLTNIKTLFNRDINIFSLGGDIQR